MMLGPKLDQFVWKKSTWYPSGPGAFKGGGGGAPEEFEKFLQGGVSLLNPGVD